MGLLRIILFAGFFLSACNDQPKPIHAGGTDTTTSSTTGSTSANSDFLNAKSTKVIFNKKYFYNNFEPNMYGCSGDARSFFNMLTDRQIPVKPAWLKNIAVDITNANALDGVSNASSCALTGLGSPAPSNCAVFDDLQPLFGAQSRSVLIGGYGCNTSSNSCSQTNGLADVWNLSMPDVSTNLSYGVQPVAIDQDATSTTNGVLWAGGDYSEVHDSIYLYGGVSQNATPVMNTSNTMTRIRFAPSGVVSSAATVTPSTLVGYGNWTSATASTYFALQPSAPAARVGATFTNAIRRDPTMKTWCKPGDLINCPNAGTASTSAKNNTEDQDYFLLLGGWDGTSASFNPAAYIYKPIAYSNTSSPPTPVSDLTTTSADGDWNLLTTDATVGTTIHVASAVSYSGTASAPYAIAATAWTGRAYHRVVYDNSMNRFYIYGGLTGNPNSSASASSELWFYDPPSLGRRPTSTCYLDEAVYYDTLGAKKLPISIAGSVSLNGTSTFVNPNLFGTDSSLGINQAYFSQRMVFPPGGCFQKVTPTTTNATARFEHSMAFDRDQKTMIVFGGCTQAPSDIADTGSTTGGDPTTACTSASLLNDTWMYVPPTTQEIVPYNYSSGVSTTDPYSSTANNRFPNIFNTDFWLWHFPLYLNNNISSGMQTAPTIAEALGFWVQLAPSSKPTKRVSASMVYDRAHHKFYLQGGYGCTDSSCGTVDVLNDLWEFKPPTLATQCSKASLTCSSNGTWTQLKSNNKEDTTIPTARKGALMMYAMPMFSHGDDYYTVQDTSCAGAGPIATSDPSVSKQYVGAIYIHLDRTYIGEKENLLLSLRMVPFDQNTKLPGIFDGGTTYTTTDDVDYGSSNDTAIIRVQALSSPLKAESLIMAAIQPRFHEYIAGTPRIADTFVYVGGASGQVTEKQILIPVTVDSSIDLIKIERVQGSLKFYEMSVSKF